MRRMLIQKEAGVTVTPAFLYMSVQYRNGNTLLSGLS